MSRHSLRDDPDHTPDVPPPPPALRGSDLPVPVGRRNVIALTVAAAVAALALGFADPGTSPALGFLLLICPLPVWAALFGAAAVLLAVRQHEVGHLLAVIGWTMLTAGAINGLITGSTRSPAISLVLAGLLLCITGLHANGLAFRRAQRAAARAPKK